jgi:hypothetical protein
MEISGIKFDDEIIENTNGMRILDDGDHDFI